MDEIRRISGVDAAEILGGSYDPLGITEYDLVTEALRKMSAFQIAERIIELPGFSRNIGFLIQCVADFRKRVDRSFVPIEVVTDDTMTIEPLRPEVFDVDTFKRTGLTVGTYDIIPTGTETWDPVKDEEVVVITDLIEFMTTVNVTAVKAAIDGEALKPEELRLDLLASDLHVCELTKPLVCDVSLDIDGKVEHDGDSELTPLGVHICLGKQIPGLT